MAIKNNSIRILMSGLLAILLLTMVLIGCQAKKDHEETFQQEKDQIFWITGFSEEDFVDLGDSFQSTLISLLKIFGQQETSSSVADIRGYPNVGTSYLKISRALVEDLGIFTTFVDLTFNEAKEQITKDRPMISRRTVRGYIEDYVLFVGYEPSSSSLVGYSILSEHPIKVNQQEWEENYLFQQLNLSLIVADDADQIRQRENSSQHYWLQIAVEAILDLDPLNLEKAITKIDELGVNVRRADYLHAYHQVFIKQELSPETIDFLDRVYEAGPNVSHAIEWKFLKHWTLGQHDEALVYLRQLEKEQKLASAFLESLFIFEEIYTDLGESEALKIVQDIISIKEADPEYLGITSK